MRANQPWIVYYDYKARYALNPTLDFLRKDAYEHRVTARLAPFTQNILAGESANVFSALTGQWLQHQWSYYNIQSLEPIQMPRPPETDSQFLQALMPKDNQDWFPLTRMWELSNTRYIIAEKQFFTTRILPRLDPAGSNFKIVHSFDLRFKAGVPPEHATIDDIEVIPLETGQFAVFDYVPALPRVKLYSQWIGTTNDQAVLDQLVSRNFDPHSFAFVNDTVSVTNAAATNFSGTVKITKYAPKHIEIAASNNAPSLLVYNDKYTPTWKVLVDGKPAPLHRANFIMRGVTLPPGNHSVVMIYEPSLTALYVSISGIAVGLLLLAFVIYSGLKTDPKVTVNSAQ
jgi:hypothetical protein